MPSGTRELVRNIGFRSLHMQVNPENVLQIRAVLLQASDRMLAAVAKASTDSAWVGLCGGDPVSRDARAAFNERVRTLVEQRRRYAVNLGDAARSLDKIARDYGSTEQQIADSFSPGRVDAR